MLMLGTGIPELREPDNIFYIRKKLYMDMTSEQAAAEFEQLIRDSIASTVTKLNNLVHNWKTQ
jgi:hypothetical protein